jgi:hypothetical protein
VLATTSLEGLEPGPWQVVGFEVVSQGLPFAPAVSPAEVTVVDAQTAQVAVAYAFPDKGSLRVNVSGLPAGTDGSVNVTGPGGFRQDLASSMTVTGLEPGPYVVRGSQVTLHQAIVDQLLDPVVSAPALDLYAAELIQSNVSYGPRLGTGMLWVPMASPRIDLAGFDEPRLSATTGPLSLVAGTINTAGSVVVDAEGSLWYSTANQGIRVVPPTTNLAGTVALPYTGNSPAGLAVAQSPGIWAAYPGLASVRFHPRTAPFVLGTSLGALSGPQITQPFAIAFCGGFFWVGNDGSAGVLARFLVPNPFAVVSTSAIGIVAGGAAFPDGIHGLACAPPGSLFASLGSAGAVIRVDFVAEGLATWHTFTVGGSPAGVAVDESGNLWITDPVARTLAFLPAADAASSGGTFTPTVVATGLDAVTGQPAFSPPPVGTTLVR